MPSRFALGSSTNASARLEALLRVMVRLACIGGLEARRHRVFRAQRRQPTGFRQSGIARAFVRVAGFAAAPPMPLVFYGRGFATRMSVTVVARGSAPTLAPKSCPNKQRRGENKCDPNDEKNFFQTPAVRFRGLFGENSLELRKQNERLQGASFPTATEVSSSASAVLVMFRRCMR